MACLMHHILGCAIHHVKMRRILFTLLDHVVALSCVHVYTLMSMRVTFALHRVVQGHAICIFQRVPINSEHICSVNQSTLLRLTNGI